MKIKLNIELNKEELRLFSKQIKIEFANSNRQITQLLDYKEKENKRRYQTGFPGPKFDPEYYTKISARLNKHMQDCCRLAIISKAYKCEAGIYQVDGQYYGVELFYETNQNLINGMKFTDMTRLVIHLMRRSGIIDKETRDKMLWMAKTKGLCHEQESKLKQAQLLQNAYCNFVDNIKHIINPREYFELIRTFNVPESIAKWSGVKLSDVILPERDKQQRLENTEENKKKLEMHTTVKNEELWKSIDMQQQHDEELEYISELLARNKDGSSIRALYLMCKMIDRDFQLPGKPDCKYAELVREAACSLIDALTLYAVKMNIDLKRDLEALTITEHKG